MAAAPQKSLAKYPPGVKIGRPAAWKAAFEEADKQILSQCNGLPQILVDEKENPENMPDALLNRLFELRSQESELDENEKIDLQVLEKIYSIVEASKRRCPDHNNG